MISILSLGILTSSPLLSHAGSKSTQRFISGEPLLQLWDRDPDGFPSPIRSCLGSHAQGRISCAEVAEPARGGEYFHSRGICRAGSFKGRGGKQPYLPTCKLSRSGWELSLQEKKYETSGVVYAE